MLTKTNWFHKLFLLTGLYKYIHNIYKRYCGFVV